MTTPRAYVFSLGNAHLRVMGRLAGLVRCVMLRPPEARFLKKRVPRVRV